jgi:hypothetical protein
LSPTPASVVLGALTNIVTGSVCARGERQQRLARHAGRSFSGQQRKPVMLGLHDELSASSAE